jgi:hypothetical protein
LASARACDAECQAAMTASRQPAIPPAWAAVLERQAPAVAREFLADVRRYLAEGAPERVPGNREAETLKNIIFAYLEPAQHEAVLYDLAVASLHQTEPRPAGVAGLVALGGAAAVGIVLASRRR